MDLANITNKDNDDVTCRKKFIAYSNVTVAFEFKDPLSFLGFTMVVRYCYGEQYVALRSFSQTYTHMQTTGALLRI